MGMFGREEYEEMAELPAGLRGRFLLSLNDTPEVRENFRAFPMRGVETKYTVSRSKNQMKVRELLIGVGEGA